MIRIKKDVQSLDIDFEKTGPKVAQGRIGLNPYNENK